MVITPAILGGNGCEPLTAAQIANPTTAILADVNTTWFLNVPPYTRYQSNGTGLVQIYAPTQAIAKIKANIPAFVDPRAGQSQRLCSFTGSQTTTTLTVASVQYGSLQIGDTISGTSSGAQIATQTITAYGTGTGGAGTYTVNQSQTIAASSPLTATHASDNDSPVPTFTSNAAITGGTLARPWYFNPAGLAASENGNQPVGSSFGTLSRSRVWDSYYANGILGVNQSGVLTGGNSVTSSQASAMHFGAAIEFVFQATNGGLGLGWNNLKFRVKVNNVYVTITPTIVSNSGANYYFFKHTFPFAALRRIDITWDNGPFIGFNTAQTDTLEPAPITGPSYCFFGDSFIYGASGNYGTLDNLASQFADFMGHNDICSSGQGGEGYVGSTNPFFTRIADTYGFDVVFLVGGRNDNGNTPSLVAAQLTACIAAVKANSPNTFIVVYGPMFGGGVYSQGNVSVVAGNLWAVQAAMQTAAVAAGVLYMNPLSRPLPTLARPSYSGVQGSNSQIGAYQPASGVLVSPVSAGASTFTVGAAFAGNELPYPGTYLIDGGTASAEYVYIKSNVSGNGNQYTIDSVFLYAHAANATVQQVGDCCLIGHGYVGATTGFGNCDLAVYSDNVHPTSYGHALIGYDIATRFQAAMIQNVVPATA
jgi:hypothetical protein